IPSAASRRKPNPAPRTRQERSRKLPSYTVANMIDWILFGQTPLFFPSIPPGYYGKSLHSLLPSRISKKSGISPPKEDEFLPCWEEKLLRRLRGTDRM